MLAGGALIEDCVLPAASGYEVGAASTVVLNGYYHLFVQRLNNPDNAVSLPAQGGGTPGDLAAGEVKSFTIAAATNDAFVVRMVDTSGFAQVSPGLRLFGQDGRIVATASGLALAVIRSDQQVSGETLVLLVDNSVNASAGSYHLFAQNVIRPGDVTCFERDVATSQSLDSRADVDTYRFYADQDQSVEIWMSETAPGGLSPALELYDINGQSIESDGDASVATITVESLPATGAYTVLAFEANVAGGVPGGYQMTIDADPICSVGMPVPATEPWGVVTFVALLVIVGVWARPVHCFEAGGTTTR